MERKKPIRSLIATSMLLLVLVAVAFWQTSLNTQGLRPEGPTQTVVLWGISILVGLGVFVLGFIVFRSLLRLYAERRRNRLGYKIKTKLVAGALALSILPVVCLVIFSFYFLNRTLDRWFSRPTEEILAQSRALTDDVMKRKVETDARWIASMPEVMRTLKTGEGQAAVRARLQDFSREQANYYVALLPPVEGEPAAEGKTILEFSSGSVFGGPVEWRLPSEAGEGAAESDVDSDFAYAATAVTEGTEMLGRVVVVWKIPQDLLARRAAIQSYYGQYAALQSQVRYYRYFYPALLALIAIFVLFVATWLALFLSKQIIVPIEALVEATGELSSGHLDYRVETPAMDELAALVESFNRMTQQLESKTRQLQESNESLGRANVELDARRRFIDAILENIAPAVVSISADGGILKTNSSLSTIFPPEHGKPPKNLQDLLSPEDFAELTYMMGRARRTGLAAREFEIERAGQILHLAVTVSALEQQEKTGNTEPPGFVVVVEDTTELLRAQKSAAWHEVARRVAHEIKNPLTPIALSAERMSRLLTRYTAAQGAPEIQKLEEQFKRCIDITVQEVETLRSLVDEFSQLARFPKAQPQRADLNRVVESALDVFQSRLEGIAIRKDLSPHLPEVFVDPVQFKRVVVNLIDNAAEAIQDSWLKEIYVSTVPGPLPETLELTVADSGHGISAEDKEKLFLPYFSTRRRGTGLGLAIVNRILTDHHATIRVEDNRPAGSRFIVEIPTAASRASVETGVSA